MPFKSIAQRKFMYAKHPKMAAEFSKATPKGVKLPEKATVADQVEVMRKKMPMVKAAIKTA